MYHNMWDLSSLNQGLNPCPPAVEGEVLTTGTPKSWPQCALKYKKRRRNHSWQIHSSENQDRFHGRSGFWDKSGRNNRILIGKDGVKGKMPWMKGVTEALQWKTGNVEGRGRGWVSLAGVWGPCPATAEDKAAEELGTESQSQEFAVDIKGKEEWVVQPYHGMPLCNKGEISVLWFKLNSCKFSS